MPVELERGYERDRLSDGGASIRWWFYARVTGDAGRPQDPRLGVIDRGFSFARGGRVASEEEAELALTAAQAEARAEIAYWRGQPSHALGVGGGLIPLDQLELTAWSGAST